MGSKLLADLGGRPLVDWAAAAMADAGIAPRAAVIRPGDDGVRTVVAARGFVAVENPRAEEGMGTSIAAGAAWAAGQGADGVLIALGDAPFVTTDHLKALTETFLQRAEASNAEIVASIRAKGDGPGSFASPAVFAKMHFAELIGLEGDQGARSVFGLKAVAGLASAPGELDDVDTAEALEAARARARRLTEARRPPMDDR
jgi:molybdenum cofactor cytidylyltransferase